MTAKVSDFVNVQITRATARLSRVGFGTALIQCEYYNKSDRVLTYSDPDEMLEDGFVVTDVAYIAALSLYSQENSPSQFKVGRRKSNINDKQTTTIDALATAGTYTIKVGAATTAAIAFDANAAAVKAALELLAGVTEVTVTGSLDASLTQIIEFTGADQYTEFATVVYNVASLTGVSTATTVHTQWGAADETYAVSLAAIIAADSDWYGLVSQARLKADILANSAIIEAQDPPKVYGVSTDDADVLSGAGGNVLEALYALSYDRTYYQYSADTAKYPEAAVFGYALPKSPGSYTLKFKPLVGISTDDLTTAQKNIIKAKNGNFYEEGPGINMISSEGVVVSGEYFDIIVGTDWVQVRMAEDVLLLLVNNEKVPFTDAGTGLVAAEIQNRLTIASKAPYNILILESIVVYVPLRADVPSADRLERLLENCTFSANYQGALHKVGIQGKLSV